MFIIKKYCKKYKRWVYVECYFRTCETESVAKVFTSFGDAYAFLDSLKKDFPKTYADYKVHGLQY